MTKTANVDDLAKERAESDAESPHKQWQREIFGIGGPTGYAMCDVTLDAHIKEGYLLDRLKWAEERLSDRDSTIAAQADTIREQRAEIERLRGALVVLDQVFDFSDEDVPLQWNFEGVAGVKQAFAEARAAILNDIIKLQERAYRDGYALGAANVGGQPEAGGWRHKKRGTTYDIIGQATAQVSLPPPIVDGTQVVVYRCREDGSLWIRQPGEFYDGRFERLPPAPTEDTTTVHIGGQPAPECLGAEEAHLKLVQDNMYRAHGFIEMKGLWPEFVERERRLHPAPSLAPTEDAGAGTARDIQREVNDRFVSERLGGEGAGAGNDPLESHYREDVENGRGGMRYLTEDEQRVMKRALRASFKLIASGEDAGAGGDHDWREPEEGEPQEEGAVCRRCGAFANTEGHLPCGPEIIERAHNGSAPSADADALERARIIVPHGMLANLYDFFGVEVKLQQDIAAALIAAEARAFERAALEIANEAKHWPTTNDAQWPMEAAERRVRALAIPSGEKTP